MKPLVIMLSCNRLECTQRALSAVRATTDLSAVDMHVIDNGSTDGSQEWLLNQPGITVDCLPDNLGISGGLNYAMQRYRQPQQHMIKIDSDVAILTKGWVDIWLECLRAYPNVAMIAGHNPNPGFMRGAQIDKNIKESISIAGYDGWLMEALVGPFVLHSGTFMDEIGFFGILAPEDYGAYRDVLTGAKANILRYAQVVIEDVQWQSCCDFSTPDRPDILQEMKPLLHVRINQICYDKDTIYVGINGKPGESNDAGGDNNCLA